MKSGLLSNATRIARIFSSPPTSTRTIAMSRGLTLSAPTGKSADPKVHGGNYSTDRNDQELTVAADKTYVPPNPANPSSPKLENIPVNKPIDLTFQQKRCRSTSSTARIEDVGCVGFDGSPWPEDGRDIKTSEEQQEEDREYFKHHKASPLSEIEVADTRKPLTKVTDGTAGGYFGGEQVITFTPEQIDTAEDSLLRAARMWREAAVRGVPEYPHSRRLRELRGEDW